MVVARNIGRLGNNMFQIAAAIGYARKYGYEWAADESNGHGEPYSSIHKAFPNLPKHKFGGGIRYHEHPNAFCEQHKQHFDDCHFNYHDIPDLGPNVTLTGFYQSWKYFEHCKEEVKEVFKLPHVEGYEDCVSVHVRRGDYVQHSGSFPPVTKDYILNSMQLFLDKNPYQRFIVFSDDIQWCKEHIKLHCWVADNEETEQAKFIQDMMTKMVTYSEGRNELQDLSLMASCGHHIIANSSFSYWGAYLGYNPNRTVICPSAETWFGPTAGVKQPVKDLILPEWIQIPTR